MASSLLVFAQLKKEFESTTAISGASDVSSTVKVRTRNSSFIYARAEFFSFASFSMTESVLLHIVLVLIFNA